MKKYDVIAIGELLIDFTQNGYSAQGNYMFEANPGGAPCNVLSMLSNLNKKTAFIGKVGDDFLGRHLRDKVTGRGIDVTGLIMDDDIHTTLAFVHTMPDGDRDFSFYRNPGADMNIAADEINEELIKDSRIFHYGSISMTHDKCREATRKAIKIAKESGCLLSFDPNLREPLWVTLDDARKQIEYGLAQCDILKISDNEIIWFTGENDFDAGVKILQEKYNIPLILLSKGRDGSTAYKGDMKVSVPAFLNDKTIETTGAGDTFDACVLNYILDHGLHDLTEEDLREMLTFANGAASLITTKKGALCSMPTEEEVIEYIRI